MDYMQTVLIYWQKSNCHNTVHRKSTQKW